MGGLYVSRWFMIAVCTCILFIIPFTDPVSAQSQITLKGIIIDKATNEPLPFATITVPQSKISVVTNEAGEFQFHIPPDNKEAQVQISYLGYKTIKLKVSEINPDVVTSFRMESQIQQLKEVEIKEKKGDTPADEIVDRAIRNIRYNYPREKTLYYGYYRDFISPAWTVSYQNLMEAALVMEDRGFQTNDFSRTKIKLEQLRYNPDRLVDSTFNQVYDGKNKFIPYASVDEAKANELALLKGCDPIRNHKIPSFSFVDILDLNFTYNHKFFYESITEEDSIEIYCIRFEKYTRTFSNQSHFNVNGKIYISSDTYAILKFNYTITCLTPTYTGKYLDVKLEYKNYNNKYYLSYLSLMNYFVLKNYTTANQVSKPYFQYRELFINKIVNEPFEPLLREEVIDKKASLLTNKVPVKEGFWDHYNYTGIPKLEEQVITEN